MSQWTSQRGPHSFNKGRGAKRAGLRALGGRFVQAPEMVCPSWSRLAGFNLKANVSYHEPAGTDQPLTAHGLFLQAVAPAVEKDFHESAFDPGRLDKYGFEHTQEGKPFQLYPKNFPLLTAPH